MKLIEYFIIMNSYQQFVCLSGLPRTGSTLLSAILSQNPNIHAEGNSAVCQMMWDMSVAIKNSQEQLNANQKNDVMTQLITKIPHFYYKNISETIVVDKCRSWTLLPNIMMAKKYIDRNIKMIIMIRPIRDIIVSFAKLYRANGIPEKESFETIKTLLIPNTEPIMRSLNGVQFTKKNNNSSTFLFIEYDELVTDPKTTIQKIYKFCGWELFEHNFDNICVKYPENDNTYGIKGAHNIRSKICKEKNCLELPKEIEEIINNIQSSL